MEMLSCTYINTKGNIMRKELETICMILVNLPEYERKQIMSVLLASMLNDIPNEEARRTYDEIISKLN